MRLIESAVLVFIFGILCFSVYEVILAAHTYAKETEKYESMSNVLDLIYKKIDANKNTDTNNFLKWIKIVEKDFRLENTSFEILPLHKEKLEAASYSFCLQGKTFRVLMLIEGASNE